MRALSKLQSYRLKYIPPLPPCLQDLHSVEFKKRADLSLREIDSEIQALFPLTSSRSIFRLQSSPVIKTSSPLKIGVLFSGGQAPGGHNVICGLFDAMKKIDSNSELIGFFDGFKGFLANRSILITEELLATYRNQGGFDLIGSDRTKIETDAQFETAEAVLTCHALDGFVIIGGDDSNTNGAFLSEFCQKKGMPVRIIGVPKTIDGDLKNEWIEASFGFDTACKIYSEMVGNILIDSLSAKKYYFFIRLMGRSASHITLECALQTHPNLVFIGEEMEAANQSLVEMIKQIADLICARSEHQKNYGLILLPEGLLEFIPQCRKMLVELNQLLSQDPDLPHRKSEMGAENHYSFLKNHLEPSSFNCFSEFPHELQKQLLLERDPHGNVQLAKIETERLLISLVEKELSRRSLNGSYKGKFSPIPLYFGYEGRSGLPSNFDSTYCYALGHTAALLIRDGVSGCMACIKHLGKPVESWEPYGIPISGMLHMEWRKDKKRAVIQKALVDLEGAAFLEYKYDRERWKKEDCYESPGPIQFEGASELTDKPCKSIGGVHLFGQFSVGCDTPSAASGDVSPDRNSVRKGEHRQQFF